MVEAMIGGHHGTGLRASRRRGGPVPAMAITILCLLLATVLTGAVPSLAVAQSWEDYQAAILPDHRDDVAASAGDLSSYVIDVTLDPAASTLSGTMNVTFVNDSGVELNEVYFRLYPNIDYYGDGALAISEVIVGGEAAASGFEVNDSALRVDLPDPLPDGETAEIMLSFTTTVPANSAGSYGIFSHETSTGTWILADWHPVLAVYEPDHGWYLDPATPAGDPTHAASSYFDVTITAPDDLTVVTSGTVVEARSSTASGLRTQRIVTGPAREFTMVVDNDYVRTSREVDGVTISVYTEPEVAIELADQVLDIAARSLAVFGELFGPYPYTELDIVQTRLDGALAVSWAGIIFIDGPSMLNRMAVEDALGMETILAHEVAHLWWGSMVGSNSNDHTFINEGLATLSSILYLEETVGPEAAAMAREQWMLKPARWLVQNGDAVADLPAGELDPGVWSAAVYGKGSLGFEAIRREIGDEAFIAALSSFADEHQFRIATPDDLRAAFATASGQNIDELWSYWFDQTGLTVEEIDAFAAD